MIIILKHSQTFQDVIAKVSSADGQSIIDNGVQSVNALEVNGPLVILPQQDPQSGEVRLALAPLSFNLRDDSDIILDMSHFVTAWEAEGDIEKAYVKQKSNIEIASSLPSN